MHFAIGVFWASAVDLQPLASLGNLKAGFHFLSCLEEQKAFWFW
jgi:hypothetical protein